MASFKLIVLTLCDFIRDGANNNKITDIIAVVLFFMAELLSNNKYRQGSTNRVNKVAVTSPPITTVAKGRCTSAPAPLLNAIGRNPSEATAAVIDTGRNL